MAEEVLDWVAGLPSGDDLTPLSQPLVTPELAAAFSIPPADHKSNLDIHLTAHHTIFILTRSPHKPSPSSKPLSPSEDDDDDCPMVLEADESPPPVNSRREAVLRPDFGSEENSDRALKRPRLVWTPQLHRRFVDVVAYLGVKNSVPKTIMQLMNVEGLTRENVASHLQKYRLYLKRMQGVPREGPSSSVHLSASTPMPQGLHDHRLQQPQRMPVPVRMIPMTIYSMPNRLAYGVVPVHNHQGGMQYSGFDDHDPHGQNNWSGGSKCGSYPHVSHTEI